MFWMRPYPLRGQVGGGWALVFESFLGPVKWHRNDRRVPFGAQKTQEFQGCINHRCIGGFMHNSPQGRFQSPYWRGWRSRCIKELYRPARAASPPLHNFKVHNMRLRCIKNNTSVRLCSCSWFPTLFSDVGEPPPFSTAETKRRAVFLFCPKDQRPQGKMSCKKILSRLGSWERANLKGQFLYIGVLRERELKGKASSDGYFLNLSNESVL
jgi:hypothetical protein